MSPWLIMYFASFKVADRTLCRETEKGILTSEAETFAVYELESRMVAGGAENSADFASAITTDRENVNAGSADADTTMRGDRERTVSSVHLVAVYSSYL